ncbi:pentraxin-related protein PTX3 [Leptodactylus fuscus]|uniref:pentraxin-related protein PTX3 n=1 Tax=Leptodactylus fuscus TaxID=238119 RepID=UPI003F4EECC5
MMLLKLFVCTIWCLSSALTIAVQVQDLDNQILVTGEVTLTECQAKDLSRWDKVMTMLENSQMRQNMLLQYVEEVKAELQTVKEDLGTETTSGSCSDCLSSITSDISRLLDSKCQPDPTIRQNVEKSAVLSIDIGERLDRIENALKKWEEAVQNKVECPDKGNEVTNTDLLIEQLNDWINQRQTPSGCDVSLLFPMRSPKIYASVHPVNMNLQSFTFCVWTKVTEALERTIVFSYGTKRNPYEIQLYFNEQSPVLVVGGDNKISAENALQKGKWSHICGTWNSEVGNTTLWVNGENKASSDGVAQGHIIPDRGIFQIGQEKNGCCVGGGFDESLSFSGKITGFNLWDNVLSDEDIVKTLTDTDCSIRGNVIGWGTTEIQPHGGAQYIY